MPQKMNSVHQNIGIMMNHCHNILQISVLTIILHGGRCPHYVTNNEVWNKITVERHHLSSCSKLLLAEWIVVLCVTNYFRYKVGISVINLFTIQCQMLEMLERGLENIYVI
jgi:hypothetical protein